MRRKIIGEWLRIFLGLMVFSLGVHLTIFANIGLAPWDCLGMGISYHTPLTYGLAVTAVSLTVLIVDLLLRERIGFGTLIDALFTGSMIQLFNDLSPFPMNQNLVAGLALMLAGFVFMALGMWIYMLCGQGCGPRDSLLVGLGKRLPSFPIGLVEVLLWASVLLAGWLLGGPVGVGTLFGTFGAGAVMQAVYSLVRFEPRNIRHRDIIEVLRELRGREGPC